VSTTRLVTELELRGARTSARADRAVVLAPGAGSDLRSAALLAVSDALVAAGIPCARFNFPYRTAGRRAPDRPAVLAGAWRDAAARVARRTKLPLDRLVLGGRSMGGRIASLVAADADEPQPALALALLGYPLRAPGRAVGERAAHFGRLGMPVLFASGTRDSFGTPSELRAAGRRIKGKVTFHWVDTGDHGFKPLRSSGLTTDAALAGVADAVVEFVIGLS
jgi:predicted alpha/beta-hydrolase family hydrolase